mmetsp:Transcript_11895/g.25881  ORF Transcript_11895/g.25881 Transcript_11895/m.25881 type:complete len:87 (+) Transcript_11895:389-649(+)
MKVVEDMDGTGPKDGVAGKTAMEEAEVRPAYKEIWTLDHVRPWWNWSIWQVATLNRCPIEPSQPSGQLYHVFYTSMVLKTPTWRRN